MPHEAQEAAHPPKDAAVLVDLDSFLQARESQPDLDLGEDMARLLRFAHQVAYPERLAIRKALGDFQNQGDTIHAQALREAPRALAEHGFELAQAHSIPGCDPATLGLMRLAAEAMAAAHAGAGHIVFVSHQPNLIPVLTQLRAQGIHASVIGLKSQTNPIIERYADQFVLFEDLAEAERVGGPWANPHVLHATREAIRQVLIQAENNTMPLGPLAGLVTRRLQEKGLQGLATDGEDLHEVFERYEKALAIALDTTGDEARVRLIAPALTTHTIHGPKVVRYEQDDRSRPVRGERPPRDRGPVVRPPTHSIEHYAWLLRSQQPKLYRIPMDELDTLTDAVWGLIIDGDTRKTVSHSDLMEALSSRLESTSNTTHLRPQALLFQLYKAGCFECTDDGPSRGKRDFHWALPAKLAADIHSPKELQERILLLLADTLADRLERQDQADIEPGIFAELLYGESATDEQKTRAGHLLDHIYEEEEAA